jgi:hypothetical protein
VRYRRLERSDPGGTVSFDVPVDPREAASAKATALRERAQRYRELARTVYNQDIVAEVEALASELEDQAGELQITSFRIFFRAA